jgi:hypothetical protein
MCAASVSLVLLRPGARPTAISFAATQFDAESLRRPVAGANGVPLAEGCAIELGFFSHATLQRPFAGRWTPLVGPRAPRENRAIPLIRIGAGGEPAGLFRWCRAFYAGVDALPPSGTPLAFRFYDHGDPAEARFFNTAAHPSWWSRSARSPSPAHVEIDIDEAATWESGAAGAFRTVLPATGGISRFFGSFGRPIAAACY